MSPLHNENLERLMRMEAKLDMPPLTIQAADTRYGTGRLSPENLRPALRHAYAL